MSATSHHSNPIPVPSVPSPGNGVCPASGDPAESGTDPGSLQDRFVLEPPHSVAVRFFEVASRSPERPALWVPDQLPVSYGTLAHRVGVLRHRLREAGVRPDMVVAVAVDDPLDWVPVLLAILSEGAVYVVLDPRWPEARVLEVLADSTATLVVCTAETRGRIAERVVPGLDVLDLSLPGADGIPGIAEPAVPRTEDSLAFLTYTSGSTGAPKGIALRHLNILHEVAVHAATLRLTPDDRLTGLYPPSTVGCTRDLYAALLTGASVAFFPFRDRGMAALRDWIRDQRLTRYHSVPPIFRELMQELGPSETLPDLQTVFLAGDRVAWSDLDLQRRHTGPACRFYTGIGASETSSLYAHGFLDASDPREGPILPSGIAVPGACVRLLDASGNPVGDSEPGEIVVQGRFLAGGYWRRGLRGAEAFPEVPGSRGDRVYRTGDMATRDRSGRLLFQGRRDQQVKILGNRIELSEVDLQLRRLPGVREVAVRVPSTSDAAAAPLLTAFVAWSGAPLSVSEIRRRLLAVLSAPAVPVRFHWLAAFPRLANGKLDGRGLDRIAATEAPEPETPGGGAPAAPVTPAEKRMASLWREVLGVPDCGLHDSFFALGGHSLAAMKLLARVRTAFAVPVTLRMLHDAPTISGLLAHLGNPEPVAAVTEPSAMVKGAAGSEGLRIVPRDPAPRASHAQERLWFLDTLEPDRTPYLMPEAVRFRGPLSIEALDRALTGIVARHESLRTVFFDGGDGLRQRILPAPDRVLDVEDLSGLPVQEIGDRVAAAKEAVLSRPFDLTRGPLHRFRLLRLGPEEHLFLRAFHHIIADGWSVAVFHRELSEGYAAAVAGRTAALPEIRHQFADLADWQRRRLEGPRLRELLDHWTKQLAGAPPRLDLPHDGIRTAEPAPARVCVRELSPELSALVDRLSRSLDATPFVVLLSVFQALLGRLSGQEDVVVGAPVAGRLLQESEPLIGFFISTLALRTRVAGNPEFRDLVHRVRGTVLDAQEHQELPFEKLIEHLHPDRGQRHHPVFQVMFNLLNFDDDCAVLPGLVSTPEPVPPTGAKFDLTLYVLSRPGSLTLRARFASDVFRESTVNRILAQFEALLSAVAANPALRILEPSLILAENLPVLPDPTAPLAPEGQPAIHAAFEEQVRRNPHRLAIRDSVREWTYAGLEAASERVAALVMAKVGRGATVGVAAVASGELVAALLGVLRAGARFLVLDAAQPPGRLQRMAALARPPLVLVPGAAGAPESWRTRLGVRDSVEVLSTDASLPLENPSATSPRAMVQGTDPAYLVFTSGSTGDPLGILGDHGPVTHFLGWQRTQFGFSETDRFSLLSGLGHDPLLRDVFGPLSIGASVHIPAQQVRDCPESLVSWFRSEGITVSHLTPPLAQFLCGTDRGRDALLPDLRWMFLGGDRLVAAVVDGLRRRAPAAGIVNFYGTTETPQAMAFHPVVSPDSRELTPSGVRDPIPIGRPIPGVQLLVSNPAGRPAGIGEVGELRIRTPYLSRGYLGADPASAVRFVSNPATGDPADRVYCTGDLGYFLEDGSVVFLGRRDGWVKVRGHRIEPDEVRGALREWEGIHDAAVVSARDSEPLDAFLVLRDPARVPTREQVRNHLRRLLPEAAIPGRFLVVPALPLTPNGKLDLRTLVEAPGVELPSESAAAAPRSASDERVLEVWRDVLGRPQSGIHDNFFDLGGHSLLALRLVTALRQRLGIEITLAGLLANPTVAAVATHLEAPGTPTPTGAGTGVGNPRRAFRGAATGTPWIHVPGVMGFEFLPPVLAEVIGRHRPFHDALQYRGLDGVSEPERTVKGIATSLIPQVEALCPDPAQPVWLSGYSMGGLVAQELARQLTARGRAVGRVILFDVRYIQEARRRSSRERLALVADRLRDRSWAGRLGWILRLAAEKAGIHGRRWLLRRGWRADEARTRLEAACWAAIGTHRPGPYDGPVTLLRAERLCEFDTGRLAADAWNGWKAWAHAEFEVVPVECDHMSIFLEPVAPAVAAALESLILRDEARLRSAGRPVLAP